MGILRLSNSAEGGWINVRQNDADGQNVAGVSATKCRILIKCSACMKLLAGVMDNKYCLRRILGYAFN